MIVAEPTLSLAALVDALALLVCGLEPDGRIVLANRRCEEIIGLPPADVIGRDWRALFATRERHDHVAAMWDAVEPDRPSNAYEALCRNGRRLRWQFSHWPVANEGGLCAVGIDVTTERDEHARRRSAERIAMLANLGAGLAHELRNPLNSASLQLSLASRKIAKSANLPLGISEHVEESSREIRRAAALLDDFLVFARPQQFVVERVEISSVIVRAVERASLRASAAGVEISIAPAPDVLVEIDPSRVEGAVFHLLANAIDASHVNGSPEVIVRWLVQGNSLVIEIEDHGPGLPSANAPVFDPFFTTKPNGTGLGLAIVERVATDHGGTIQVERLGISTVFRLHLPIVSGVVSARPPIL